MTEPDIEYANTPIDWLKVALSLLALGIVSMALYVGVRSLLEHRRGAVPAPTTVVAAQSPSQGEMRSGIPRNRDEDKRSDTRAGGDES